MRISHLLIGLLSAILVGHVELASAQAVADKPAAEKAAADKKEPAPEPVEVTKGKVLLTPKNTTIKFVGAHKGPQPDPRTGYFSKFKGELAIDEATKAPATANVEIETASLITPIDKLTGHLRSPDFFDVEQFPKATFKATKFEATDAAAGKYKVTGELTIRENKKSITFPAVVKVSDGGAVMTIDFKLKRSDFGFTFGPDRIVE
jgi:polyisoprenoid-binding protein YceI